VVIGKLPDKTFTHRAGCVNSTHTLCTQDTKDCTPCPPKSKPKGFCYNF